MKTSLMPQGHYPTTSPSPRSARNFLSKALALGAGLLGLFAAHQAVAAPVIYTIGDSTVQSYTAGYYPRAGWGQVLGVFFDATKVTVSNKGAGGTSSKSFYENQWPAVLSLVKAGDYVTIGFGINDSAAAPRRTEPFTTFKEYLTKFVNETKAKGAFPIIVATQPRNAWSSINPPTIYPAYHDYPVASRQLAGEIRVPLIDLDQRGIALLQPLGPIYSSNFIYHHHTAGEWANYPNGSADDVHFQEMGAIELAKLVVAGIRALSADANVSKLIPMLKPTFKVTFTTNNASGGLVTRTENFPAGLTVTAKAWPYAGYTFTGWSGSVTGTSTVKTFTMGTSALTINANFSGAAVVIQAESGTRAGTGTVLETTNTGYRGTSYVNFPTTGGSLTFNNVNGGRGGTRLVRIRYALGATTARTGEIVINGVVSKITFNPTGAFTTWLTVDAWGKMTAGNTNTIVIRSTGADLGNVDEINVR